MSGFRSRAIGAALAAAVFALPAAAEPPAAPVIRGGEHGDFTRLVVPLASGAPWSLRASADAAEFLIPGRGLTFDTSGALTRLRRGRVMAVDAVGSSTGTRLTITLGCDCSVTATRIDSRLVALDVAPNEAPVIPPPRSRAEARADRDDAETRAVASAEAALLGQLEHAARQGVIDLDGPPSDATSPPPRPRGQVDVTTVIDRDRAARARRTPPECLPDARFDLFDGAPATPDYPAERAEAEARLLSEFDSVAPRALAALIRIELRHGLGLEARGLLAAMPAPFPDRALLADLAAITEGAAPAPAGPLLVPGPCPGAHGFWQALAGRLPEATSDLDPVLAALPAEARSRLGPVLVTRLLGAGEVVAARRVLDAVTRAGLEADPEVSFATARVLAAERRPSEAAPLFAAVAQATTERAGEARIRHARLTLATGAPTRELAEDLAIAARMSRDLPRRARTPGARRRDARAGRRCRRRDGRA